MINSNEIQKILKDIKKIRDEIRSFDFDTKSEFQISIIASFVKVYDFCELTYSNKTNGYSLFLFPSLRGICEEIITFSFLREKFNKKDTNAIIRLYRLSEQISQRSIQHEYFKENRPFQPVLAPPSNAKDIKKDIVKNLKKIYLKNKALKFIPNNYKLMPTTKKMAESISTKSLKKLYDFIFSLTSKSVHFSPTGLQKMAWGEPPNFKVSTDNFDNYYRSQCQTYGVFLLISFVEHLSAELECSDKLIKLIEKLRIEIKNNPRWPELITFEEMNMKHPNQEILSMFPPIFAAMHNDKFPSQISK